MPLTPFLTLKIFSYLARRQLPHDLKVDVLFKACLLGATSDEVNKTIEIVKTRIAHRLCMTQINRLFLACVALPTQLYTYTAAPRPIFVEMAQRTREGQLYKVTLPIMTWLSRLR